MQIKGFYPNWLRNQVIRNKIIAIYIPLIIVPLLVLGFASNSIYTNAIVDKTISNVSDNSSLIITRMNGILTNAESCANILTINLNRVIQDHNKGEIGPERSLQLSTLITNQLSFALLVFPDVESAAFIDTYGTIYGTSAAIENAGELQPQPDTLLQTAMLKRIGETTGQNIWFPMDKRDFLTLGADEPVLTVGKKINNIYTGQELGLLVLNVKEQSLSAIYNNIGTDLSGSYMLTDQAGTIVSSTDKEQLLKPVGDEALRQWINETNSGSTIDRFQGDKLLVISSEMPKFGWKLISMEPFNALTADNRKITALIMTIGFFCFLFALMGAGILNRLIARPIVLLTKYMKLVKEGNLTIQLPVKSNDELGLLASGFNTMLTRINQLLDNVRFEQKKKREYELALIQSQIKPHFLYNTLDVIYTLSEIGRVKDVQRTTKSLADYYRIVLSQGREAIPLQDELQGLRDYLAIQRIRYADVFDYQIDVQPEVLSCTVLKLTLQPLVENAIYHGLKTKGEFGHLVVTGRIEGQNLLLTVQDDGVGIPPERLETLLQPSENTAAAKTLPVAPLSAAGNTGSSFGLRSVDSRIKLYFGEGYGLTLVSRLGVGTEIQVRLPMEQHEETGGGRHVEFTDRG
ncbi:sensor histidine kinase [Paenibacillus sp. CF384]|uniref:sensor histidine kinase n=1 Tax=Paenibacillus sp. CF384 TaxID=1884382 RepID=UPI00089BC8A9|nr:sensor histidine kinase [Paenibacillus sp. CF384]SDW66762.1 two-component system, sensor histidine kinase YesM [Paenibacillus sp. CF384]